MATFNQWQISAVVMSKGVGRSSGRASAASAPAVNPVGKPSGVTIVSEVAARIRRFLSVSRPIRPGARNAKSPVVDEAGVTGEESAQPEPRFNKRSAARRWGISYILPSSDTVPAPEANAATIRRACARSASLGANASLMMGT